VSLSQPGEFSRGGGSGTANEQVTVASPRQHSEIDAFSKPPTDSSLSPAQKLIFNACIPTDDSSAAAHFRRFQLLCAVAQQVVGVVPNVAAKIEASPEIFENGNFNVRGQVAWIIRWIDDSLLKAGETGLSQKEITARIALRLKCIERLYSLGAEHEAHWDHWKEIEVDNSSADSDRISATVDALNAAEYHTLVHAAQALDELITLQKKDFELPQNNA